MFEIDLQRSGKRSETALGTVTESNVYFALIPMVAALVVLVAVLWIASGRMDRRIQRQRAEVTELEATVNRTRQELAELAGKRRVIFAVQPQDIYWSDQFRFLAERLPDKTWITQVNVVTGGGEKGPDGKPTPIVARGLAIEGGVLSNPNEGNLDVVGKFVEDLQADPRFAKTFARIHLDSVKRGSDPNALTFQLTLDFKA
jgi:hypothetical protein